MSKGEELQRKMQEKYGEFAKEEVIIGKEHRRLTTDAECIAALKSVPSPKVGVIAEEIFSSLRICGLPMSLSYAVSFGFTEKFGPTFSVTEDGKYREMLLDALRGLINNLEELKDKEEE